MAPYRAEWLTLPLGELTAEGLLVIPESASSECPAPLVIAQHGIGSTPERPFGLLDDGDHYHHYAEELVKAGFAVLSPMNLRESPNGTASNVCAVWPVQASRESSWSACRSCWIKSPRTPGSTGAGWHVGSVVGRYGHHVLDAARTSHQGGRRCRRFNHRRNKMTIPDARYSCFLETEEEHAFFQGWLTEFTDSDVVSLICPRPLLVQHGKKDRIAHWPQVVEEFEASQQHYQMLEVPDRIELDLHEGGHEPRVEGGVRFLRRWLIDQSM